MDRASDYMMARPKAINFSWFGPELFRLLLGPPGLNWLSSFASDFQWCCLAVKGSQTVTQHVVSGESSSLLLHTSSIKT